MSGYAVTAQFYDCMAADQHAAIDAGIAKMLDGLDTSAGPVLDIGAGTGLTTRVIAKALPEAEILAIEPDPAMRAALMTRVWSSTDLRKRVTILAGSVLEAELPTRISAAIASASLVHFNRRDRRRLLALLGERLAPSGRVVLEIQCPEAIDIPETQMAIARVGRLTYEGHASARRLDAERQRWRMTYRTLDGDRVLSSDTTEHVCWTISAEKILREAAAFNLNGAVEGTLLLLTPAQSG